MGEDGRRFARSSQMLIVVANEYDTWSNDAQRSYQWCFNTVTDSSDVSDGRLKTWLMGRRCTKALRTMFSLITDGQGRVTMQQKKIWKRYLLARKTVWSFRYCVLSTFDHSIRTMPLAAIEEHTVGVIRGWRGVQCTRRSAQKMCTRYCIAGKPVWTSRSSVGSKWERSDFSTQLASGRWPSKLWILGTIAAVVVDTVENRNYKLHTALTCVICGSRSLEIVITTHVHKY